MEPPETPPVALVDGATQTSDDQDQPPVVEAEEEPPVQEQANSPPPRFRFLRFGNKNN